MFHKIFPFPYHSQWGARKMAAASKSFWDHIWKVAVRVMFLKKQQMFNNETVSALNGQSQTLQMCVNSIWILRERVGSFISHLSFPKSERTQPKFTASTTPYSTAYLTAFNTPNMSHTLIALATNKKDNCANRRKTGYLGPTTERKHIQFCRRVEANIFNW